jgi:hypothetical protein
MVPGGFEIARSCGLAAALIVCAEFAAAQQAQNPAAAQAPAEAPAPQPAPPPQAGLPTPPEIITGIGRFIAQSISNIGAGMRGAGDAIGGATGTAGDVAKGVGDAAGAVARLPLSNVVSGRAMCALAPNGAPDCATASLELCRSKGFARGASLDITTAYKCPPQMWREGRSPNPAECTDEAFVSRAICQ